MILICKYYLQVARSYYSDTDFVSEDLPSVCHKNRQELQMRLVSMTQKLQLWRFCPRV